MKSWATLLQEESQKQVREPKGKGWLTAKEIQAKLGCGRNKLFATIARAVKNGAEVFNGTQRTRNGSFSQQVWYRLK